MSLLIGANGEAGPTPATSMVYAPGASPSRVTGPADGRNPAGFDERAGLAGDGEEEGVAGGLGGRDLHGDRLPGQRELGCVDPQGDRLGGLDDDVAGGEDVSIHGVPGIDVS